MRAILWALAELYGTERLGRTGTLGLARLNAPRLADLEDAMEGALHWSGGEALRDCRKMLHYFRTTNDGRIAFGWGGGLTQDFAYSRLNKRSTSQLATGCGRKEASTALGSKSFCTQSISDWPGLAWSI